MKNLPNIITSVRLLAALILIWDCVDGSGSRHFLALFGAAGVSDMLDGFIARRFNWCTEFGAKLDSISDLILYLSVILFLALNATAEVSSCLFLLIMGAAVQAFHISFALVKFRQFPAYHSTFSRLCAYIIFFGVIGFWLTRNADILKWLAVLWCLCSCEGLIISRLLKRAENNIDGIGSALLRSGSHCNGNNLREQESFL